jgi:hypothetical protein
VGALEVRPRGRITRQPQGSQLGASAWIAHSKLSKTLGLAAVIDLEGLVVVVAAHLARHSSIRFRRQRFSDADCCAAP